MRLRSMYRHFDTSRLEAQLERITPTLTLLDKEHIGFLEICFDQCWGNGEFRIALAISPIGTPYARLKQGMADENQLLPRTFPLICGRLLEKFLRKAMGMLSFLSPKQMSGDDLDGEIQSRCPSI